jgi:hypothetical protein
MFILFLFFIVEEVGAWWPVNGASLTGSRERIYYLLFQFLGFSCFILLIGMCTFSSFDGTMVQTPLTD